MTPLPVSRLSQRDESDLVWFFSRGMISFERSTMGGMLERSELYSTRQYPEQRRVYDAAGRCIGYESGITARPTAELRAPGGYVPDDEVLTRFAHVSAVLKRIERQSAVCVLVLELWYGDMGLHFAGLEQPYGRAAALFHVTAKGQQLVEASRKDPNAARLDLTASQRMATLIDMQRRQPKRERGAALATCAEQAKQLELASRAAWLAVTRGKRQGQLELAA